MKIVTIYILLLLISTQATNKWRSDLLCTLAHRDNEVTYFQEDCEIMYICVQVMSANGISIVIHFKVFLVSAQLHVWVLKHCVRIII